MHERISRPYVKTPINADLAQRVQDEIGQNVYLCYQCVKCTSGCPVGEFFDWQPNQIMRALQLGQEDIALHAANALAVRLLPDVHHALPAGIGHHRDHGVSDAAKPERAASSRRCPKSNMFNEAFLREVRCGAGPMSWA